MRDIRGPCVRGEGGKLDLFFFFSIVRHASTKRIKPATRGMASQLLRTFERICSLENQLI